MYEDPIIYEDTSTLIGKGFDTWRTNLNICVPYILQGAATVAVVGLLVALAVGLYLEGHGDIVQGDFQNLDPEEILAVLGADLIPLATLSILAVVLVTLISAFFTAGAVGMSRRATEKGYTGLDTMWSAGKAHFVSLFLATILTTLIVMAGAFLVLALVYAAVMGLSGPVPLDPSALENLDTAAALPIVVGLVAFIGFALLTSLALALVPYALVIDDLGPLAAIKRGVGFFWSNKFEVFMIWLIVIAISMALSLPGQLLGDVPNGAALWSFLSSMISLVVLAPLSTVWWTRLYMVRTKKSTYVPDRYQDEKTEYL